METKINNISNKQNPICCFFFHNNLKWVIFEKKKMMHYKVHVFENVYKTIIHSGKRNTFCNISKSANMKLKLKLTLPVNHFVTPILTSTYPQKRMVGGCMLHAHVLSYITWSFSVAITMPVLLSIIVTINTLKCPWPSNCFWHQRQWLTSLN